MSTSALLRVAAAAGFFFAVFVVWLIGGWGGPTVIALVGDFGAISAGCFAAWCALSTARRATGRLRRGWGMLAAAACCWVLGDSLWALLTHVFEVAPFPSVADIGFLLFYVCACVALILLRAPGTVHFALRAVLDGLIVAGSLFIILWVTGLEQVLQMRNGAWFAFAISVIYPLADVVLLTVAMLILSTASRGQRAVPTTICSGVALLAVADSAFVVLDARGRYVSGGWVDVAWAGGLLLLGIAAALGDHQRQPAFGAPGPPTRFGSSMPYLLLPITTICVVSSHPSLPLLLAALTVVIAVACRQYVVADENRRLLTSLSELASRDPLTGLANRTKFHDRLTRSLSSRRHGSKPCTLLSVDLDDFKSVNDSLGHIAGDELLVAVANRLTECAGEAAVVARLGGDEFMILHENETEPSLETARKTFGCFDEAFTVDGHLVLARASIGVTNTGSAAIDTDTFLKQADMALYSAKRSGGGIRVFTAEMERAEPPAQHSRQILPRRSRNASSQLAAQLRHALDNGELGVVYQPQFSVSTGAMVAVEVLVRWHHPQRGELRPDEFLPVARHNDLMGALTDEVMRIAVGDVNRWRRAGSTMPFAVNLFPPSLGDPGLPDRLATILRRGGLTGSDLTVEITEDVLLANEPTAREVLHHLRTTGVRVSIDDFGSGYAGLNYLRGLPVDEVKLDRHLVAPMITDPRADAIVAAMVGLSHTLGITCVAEGVENKATVRRLVQLECDIMQGYFCGEPVPAAEIDLGRHVAPPVRSVR